jgi:hypothetical protein
MDYVFTRLYLYIRVSKITTIDLYGGKKKKAFLYLVKKHEKLKPTLVNMA